MAVAGQVAFGAHESSVAGSGYDLVARTDRERILKAAEEYVNLEPQTLTFFRSDRSPGGSHDFFSQADYFWPDPKNPGGPYRERDGQSNPDNFTGHRKAMIALSVQMPALTAAWLLTRNRRYGEKAAGHLRAWFVTPATRMNPNLEFAQGVVRGAMGRSWGIIDTLHLVEVARAASIMRGAFLSPEDESALKGWFRDYLQWLMTSKKGMAERDAANNHGTCWALQVAEFAKLIGAEDTRDDLRERYKRVLLPNQMGQDGGFPLELKRTKPYSYSIFNLDVMAGLCQSLSRRGDDLFRFSLSDGRGICKGAAFLYPYLKDKGKWAYTKDVEHFDALPVRSPSLLFCGLACDRQEYLTLWTRLDPDPKDTEIVRNYPIRQPLLWMSRD
ncbi:alginate lyase family protein [Edaphobacter bradus]|uniref:alginate lyase family protein n=1 Tax=Edaphobacter bradus TaxID=2259016 RepID=UPI0021E0A441|nr:alginate lyase family protein [Edaphobacter bradus]